MGAIQQLSQRVQLLGTLINRVNLFTRLGNSYGGDRDLYQALGWKVQLTVEDYHAQYSRNAIAAAVINRPVDATWRGDIFLRETGVEDETKFEKAWVELNNQFKLKSLFSRLDKLIGLGEYGVFLLGFGDVANANDWQKPLSGGVQKLIYIKPLSQKSAPIASYVENPQDPRYGLPEFYNITVALASGSRAITIKVHYSRIMHVSGMLLESEVAGQPRLMPVFNNCSDIEKLAGGSAEMFWRGARPGYQGKVDPEYTMTEATKEALEAQIDEYEHNLRRVLINEGVEMAALASQVADPSAHLDVQLQLISAETGIPKRILTGSERGELASSSDDDNWNNTIKSRREEYAEVEIVRPFVDLCLKCQILPKLSTDKYEVEWTDLWAQSDKEKAEIGEIRSRSWKNYAETPAGQEDMPIESAFAILLGLSNEEIELLMKQRQDALANTDVEDIMGEEDDLPDEETDDNEGGEEDEQ